jgi:uncharacterized protein (DUF1778 family)
MRTTVRLKGELLDLAKRKAAAEGRSLTAFIEAAVRAELARVQPRRAIKLPVSKAKGGFRAGVDLIKTNALEDELDLERGS